MIASASRSPDPSAVLAVEMRGVSKSFGELQALDDVALEVRRGEIHGLLGENGAGKTTLMNILTGMYRADGGAVTLDGQAVELRQPADAVAHGVGMVHQHFELVHAFTAMENILLGADKGRWSSDQRAHRTRIAAVAERYGFGIDLDRRVDTLEVGERQKVEILRVLYAGANILILDEPTTHLTPSEAKELFSSISELAAGGLAVILISHKLHDVMAVCDRLTVLRRGRVAGSLDVAGARSQDVVSMMIGTSAEFTDDRPASREIGAEAVLVLERLTAAAKGLEMPLVDVSLRVHGGELVGVAGVAGNGQRELMELLAGVRSVVSGRLLAKHVDLTTSGVAERIQAGIAVLPGDRIREGILPSMPLYETFALGRHVLCNNRFSPERLRADARAMIDEYDVRTQDELVPTASLSGGNIQKVLVARAFDISRAVDGGVVIAMNPTSGLDVGSAAFVHAQLVAACENGKGVLLISEDLDELLSLCDRVVVISGGRLVGQQVANEFDPLALGEMMVATRG